MNIRYRLEASLLWGVLALLHALGPVRASNFAGWLARRLGPLLAVTGVADANLRLAMPELDAPARRRIIAGVYDNLGRTIAELPHLAALHRNETGPGWEIAPECDAAMRVLAAHGGPAIFLTAHFGNWEILPAAAASFGVPLAVVYRAANNPLVDAMINRLRDQGAGGKAVLFPKGAEGARATLRHLSGGGYLGILPDQKMNDGIEVPFFGHPAMTAPALAALALRYRCPVIPAYAYRIGPARLRIVCEPSLVLPESGDRQADILALTLSVNQCLERWIRARPECWFWLHRRWPRR